MKRTLALLTALILLLWPATPQAHPTSPTFVVVRVPGDGTVAVEVTANRKALSLALAALNDREAAGEKVTQIVEGLEKLADLRADGTRVELKCLEVADTPDREGLVTARLVGSLHTGSTALQWRAPFLLGAYPLAVAGGSTTEVPDTYDWIAGNEPSREYRLDSIGVREGAWSAAVRMVPTGFTHILPLGLDHMLFMIGLFLMSSTWRSLLLQVSAFTAAHSLTLALGVFGAVSMPSRIIPSRAGRPRATRRAWP